MDLKKIYDKGILKLGDMNLPYVSNSNIYKSLNEKREQEHFNEEKNKFYEGRRDFKRYNIDRLKVNDGVKRNLEVLLLDEHASFSKRVWKTCHHGTGEVNIGFYFNNDGEIIEFNKNHYKNSNKYSEGKLKFDEFSKYNKLKGWSPVIEVSSEELENYDFSIKEAIIKSVSEEADNNLSDTIKFYNRISEMVGIQFNYEDFVKNMEK